MSTTTTHTHVPLSERINLRLIAFGLIALLLVGTPIYWYAQEVLSGGIRVRGDVTEVNLKAMSSFPFDQINGTIDDIDPKWRALDGKKVQLVGEMYLGNSAGDQLRQFDLVYSIAKCCFSGPPQIQHFVQSKGRDGKALPYYPGLVKVTGTLHVNVKKGPERIESVYQMDVDSIEQG